MEQQVVFDIELLKKYDISGPRYTSYPTAPQFSTEFTEQDYRSCIAESEAASPSRPLSLYVHLPFCDTICYYCACNKIVTKDRARAVPYLEHLHKEIAMQATLFDSNRVVEQLHWGGGTPTFISHAQMTDLMQCIRKHFSLADDAIGEYSIEIDPREANAETIAVLREIGFNRLSLGVQDLDEQVQKAVNRVQSEQETFAVIDAARAEGFRSISLDLMYGLPHQTVEGFTRTLDRVLQAEPDRLSLFNYAHMPTLFKPQRRINEDELPDAQTKLDILQASIEHLGNAGYVYIGMDHFARPDDELAVAQREGKLHRNFQGYSTHADCDLVALGVTAIGQIGNSYSQNQRETEPYYEAIDAGKLPLLRGMRLSEDDRIRRRVIQTLICHFVLDFASIDAELGIDCRVYFAKELERLAPMQADGLLDVSETGIQVLPAGQLLIRNICMVFDAYLQDSAQKFSKVI
ncbi:MAG: oxygen-independent coproporphyrinogen III oxidase [Gammaproteobacteria bacterium]|nr:oxygen-independent coproporphyrinogen III oxidase [Gammaproteobacteria bacterium]